MVDSGEGQEKSKPGKGTRNCAHLRARICGWGGFGAGFQDCAKGRLQHEGGF